MAYTSIDVKNSIVFPLFVKGLKDSCANVKFTSIRLIIQEKAYIESTAFNNTFIPALKNCANDEDPDVRYYADKALKQQT